MIIKEAVKWLSCIRKSRTVWIPTRWGFLELALLSGLCSSILLHLIEPVFPHPPCPGTAAAAAFWSLAVLLLHLFSLSVFCLSCLPFLCTSFAPYVLAAAKWSLSGYIQCRSLLGVLCWVALPAAGKCALCCLGISDLIPSLTAGATPPKLWLMLPNLCLHTDNDGRFLPRKLYIIELTSL